jgi:hypothetical protein
MNNVPGNSIADRVSNWCVESKSRLGQALDSDARLGQEHAHLSTELRSLLLRAREAQLPSDDGIIQYGAAGLLCDFDRILRRLAAPASYRRVTDLLAGFEMTPSNETSWAPAKALEPFEHQIARLMERIDDLCARVSYSQSPDAVAAAHQASARQLLDTVRQAPIAETSTSGRNHPFYVPKHARADKAKSAAWTVGISLLLATTQNALLVLIFVGLAIYFVALMVVTNSIDNDEQQEAQQAADFVESLKHETSELHAQSENLLAAMRRDMESRLDDAIRSAAGTGTELVSLVKSIASTAHRASGMSLGQIAASDLVSWLYGHSDNGNFLALQRRIQTHKSLSSRVGTERLEIADCLAAVRVNDCDQIHVLVDDKVTRPVGTMLVFALLQASTAGRSRFIFVEPGRLAEGYRVFGALNESPSTRLGERLYITHLGEVADAVSVLRTYVGRIKEAVTRKADEGFRVGNLAGEGGEMFLQRAIVVLDRTEESRWPEKDSRRLEEYVAELRALAEVGAKEGSVLLIELERKPIASIEGFPGVADRRVEMVATSAGFILAEDMLARFPEATNAAAIGALCDQWSEAARKADTTLSQKEAKLDWSDSVKSDTRYGLEVEIGRYGADRPARLVLGKDGGHHAICIGRTGSGKTNLFHVVIGNLVRRYSPEELELYLLDFKEGVEFAAYAEPALPHCRAVAIDSDRPFGLSVLTHLRRELNRRASLFKAAGSGIANLETYEKKTGENMPRIVLLIDEFQVLLQVGEKMAGASSGAAATALEDLVRRGRSFGLHVILGSQTLAGRELTPATLAQLAVRIVLPCSPADAFALLGEQNVSNQLRGPGDAIVWRIGQGDVSDSHLAKIYASNSDDVAQLAEASCDYLARSSKALPAPFIFRGSGPTGLEEVMPHLLEMNSQARNQSHLLFALGSPTSFGERPVGHLKPERARNVLLVHRNDDTRAGFLYSALESLLTINAAARVFVCDFDRTPDIFGNSLSDLLRSNFPDRVVKVDEQNLAASVESLSALDASPDSEQPVVFAINGIGRSTLARCQPFGKLLREGSERGVHVVATLDSLRNVERFAERAWMSEFGIRAMGPASASDSQKFLDSGDAEMLSGDHQYFILDDTLPGRLTRLQVLTPSLRPKEQEQPELIAEVTNG